MSMVTPKDFIHIPYIFIHISTFEGELNRDGGWGGGGLILAKTIVSVFHKELDYKVAVERLKYKRLGGHAAEDQKQIRTSSSFFTSSFFTFITERCQKCPVF